tara:strand:+ start:735 stop:863 length:129 start_codon:yes stop_codon:yes gene_type:complete
MKAVTWKALDPETFDLITIRNGVVIARTSRLDKIINHIKHYG